MNEPTDDLHQLFASHRHSPPSMSLEAELATVREQSAHRQRRRIFASTAAAGLLLVGGGALVMTQTGASTEAPVGVADVADIDPDAPIDPRPAESDDEPDLPVSTDDPDDFDDVDDTGGPDDVDDPDDLAGSEDSTFPAPPEIAPWPEDLEIGSDEFFEYAESQRDAIEEWFDQISDWVDEKHDTDVALETDFDLNEWCEELTLDLEEWGIEEWGIDVDTWITDPDNAFPAEVVIVDGELRIDGDGDGVVDRTIDLGEFDDFDFELPDFDELDFPPDIQDFDVQDFDTEDFEVLLPEDFNIEDFDVEDFDLEDFDF